MITGAEFERRIRRASQLRAFGLGLRESARRAHEEGKIPFKPGHDMRSDYAHWRRVAEEKGYKFNEAGEIIERPAGNQAGGELGE